METERLLPKRGGEVMEAAEERRKRTSIHPPVHESVTLIIEVALFKRQILRLESRMNALRGAFIYYLLKKKFCAQCFVSCFVVICLRPYEHLSSYFDGSFLWLLVFFPKDLYILFPYNT